MMRTPKAILFDLEDTLISFGGGSQELWQQCCIEFLQSHDMPFELEELLQVLFRIKEWYWGDPARHKRGREDLIMAHREIVGRIFLEMGIRDKRLVCELADAYSFAQDAQIHLFPDTLQTLKHLASRNVRLGLVTNGSSATQRGKLKRFDMERFFDAVLIDQVVGFSKQFPKPTGMILIFGIWTRSTSTVWMETAG